MSKKQIDERYSHDDLPKIKNPITYAWFCINKIGAFFFFGFGAVLLAILVFPFIRLFTGKKKDFGIAARAFVSGSFRAWLKTLAFTRSAVLRVEDKQAFRNMHSKIIIANHPSILDFVYIMSLVPNATCIVREGLKNTPLGGVIRQAYITNSTDFSKVCEDCKKLTDKGCNVIIFPEGTRCPRHGQNNYKKGAARLALYCGCNVQPLFIGGSDKYGLGKHDPVWSYNHQETYVYDIKILPEIETSEFKDLSEPIAAKHLTEKMEQTIRSYGDEYKKSYTGKTMNSY